jgi:decaprenyl-phosphate phosphoribosyltransferase
VRPRRGRLHAILVTARPKQWAKNALVIAAPGAAGALGHDDVPGRVALACLAFCLISAGIYAINDSRDMAEDRHHPRKRFRPVAAGELEPREAVVLGVGWLLTGLALCYSVRPLLGVVGAGYVALTIGYTLLLRHIPVLDIVAIAGGFVLRALAGGVAAPVTLSRWFVLVVTAVAVFIAAGKRQAEVMRTAQIVPSAGDTPVPSAGDTRHPRRRMRRVLAHYSLGRLRLLLAGSGGLALFAYGVWAFQRPDADGIPWRLLTVIPFTICILRYGALVRAGAGEAPEEMVLADRVLLLGGLVWLVLFALGVHAASG